MATTAVQQVLTLQELHSQLEILGAKFEHVRTDEVSWLLGDGEIVATGDLRDLL